MRTELALALLTAGALMTGVTQTASAALYTTSVLDGSQGWYQNDTRAGGSAEVGVLGGREALILTTDSSIAGSSQAKASVKFDTTGPRPLRHFSVGSLEWYRDSSSSDTSPGQLPSLRLVVQNTSGETAELVWEWAETVGGPALEDTWVTQTFGGANDGYWIYSGSHNFFNPPTSVNDGTTAGDPDQYVQTMAFWANGGRITDGAHTSILLDQWTQVIGLTISMGSGVEGYYMGGVSSLHVGYMAIPTPPPGETPRPVKPGMDSFRFAVGDPDVTPSVPEPATAALGTLVLGALAMATRRRRV